MTIDELIELLAEMRAIHGDMEVRVSCYVGITSGLDSDRITLQKFRETEFIEIDVSNGRAEVKHE